MKKTRQQDFLLGLTAIIIAAGFVATVLFLTPTLGEPTRDITVRFRHKDGMAPLKPGSPVVLAGALQVGKVTSVDLRDLPVETPQHEPTSELHIIVTAAIRRDLTLFENCQITTDQPAVGGGGSLVILDVGSPPRILLDSRIVAGLPPQSFAATISILSRRLLQPDGLVDHLEQALDPLAEGSIVNRLTRSLTDVNEITRELRAQFSPGEDAAILGRIHAILADLNALTAALRQEAAAGNAAGLIAKVHTLLDRLAAAINDAGAMVTEIRPAVRNSLASIENTTRTLDEQLVAAAARELDRNNPDALLGKLHAGMDRLNRSLADVQTITDAGRKTITLNRPQLDKALTNLGDMSEQLRLTAQELRLAPWRLLYRPSPRESDELSVFEAARTFAEAATYLDDAAGRLETAAQAAPPGSAIVDEDVREIQQSLKAAFERFEKAEQFLYEKMRRP